MITALPEGQKTKPPPRRRKKQDQPAAVPQIAQEAAHYCEDLHASISRRAYDFYAERGYRAGCALQDWLDAEREIVSREQPA